MYHDITTGYVFGHNRSSPFLSELRWIPFVKIGGSQLVPLLAYDTNWKFSI